MTTWLPLLVEHPLGQGIGWALMHSLWQGAVIALALAAVLRFMRNGSPQSRWLVSCAALAGLAAAPIVTTCIVGFESSAKSDPVAWLPALSPAPNAGIGQRALVDDGEGKQKTQDLSPAAPAAGPEGDPSGRALASSFSADLIAIPSRIRAVLKTALPWIVLAWLVGVAAMSFWHFGGWLLLEWTKRRLTQAPANDVVDLFDCLRRRLGFRRPVRLLETAAVSTPIVFGAICPVILLPLGILGGLTPTQLEAVLAHELAHIRRHDYLISLLQAALETLMFYHPAVWWISARVRQESEVCCDAWTLAACPDRKDYAAALVRAAEWAGERRSFAIAATGGHLAARIRRILGLPPVETRGRRWPAALVLVTVLLVVCFAFPVETERAIAEQAVVAKFDHFLYMRHNVTNGLAETDSLILVKAKADRFEERVIYTKKNLHLGWQPLLVRGGQLYAVHINELLRIDIARGTVEKLDSKVGYYWRGAEKLYAAIVDNELRIYDLALGAYRGVAAPASLRNGPPRTLKVSPEGRRVAFFKANVDEKLAPGTLHGYKLQLVDLATGQTEEMGPEIHTVFYSVESPNLEGKPPPFAWLDEKTILTFSEAPSPIVGLSPEGKVLSPATPCKVAVLDLTSGNLTEIASLPRWQQWYSQPRFRDPDANGVPRIVLGELGQFRIDLRGKRVVEDDALRGEYRYRGGRPPEQIAIGDRMLAEGPRFDGVSVAPNGGAAIWQTETQNNNVLWYHNTTDGKVREVARGWFPRAYDFSFLWARGEDLTPAPAAKLPDGWKAIPKVPRS
jgi:beta-lactamase regulating signal transducer with metallopeptidase domain